MITKRKIEFIKQALKLKGTPFKWYGRNTDGVDCLGLFLSARNLSGYPFFDYLKYSKLPRNKEFPELMEKLSYTSFNNYKDLEVGDIILFKHKKSIYAHHLGIYLGYNKYIHSCQEKGVVIEEIKENKKNDIHCIYRI